MDHSEKYLALTYRYLGIRNRSEKEIRDYLLKKKAESSVIEHIVALLYEHKLLNDEAFARGWVRSRARFRPKGKRVIAMELKQKGIDREVIEKVMAETDEEIPDELTQAKNLIVKRIEKLRGAPRQEIYSKVGAFLARRGYNWDVIKEAIDSEIDRS